MNDLTGLTFNFIGNQAYIAILIDEMKIESNLVFDKHSGELSGFVDLGDPDKNFTSMDSEDENFGIPCISLISSRNLYRLEIQFSLLYNQRRNVNTTLCNILGSSYFVINAM